MSNSRGASFDIHGDGPELSILLQDAYDRGTLIGFETGYKVGYAAGHDKAIESAFEDGYANGHQDGYQEGRSAPQVP